MMTVAQATEMIQKLGGQFVSKKDGVDWYRARDASWIAWRQFANGQVELRKLPAGSCNC